MSRLMRLSLLAFFILMLGGILPIITPSLDPAPIARAEGTQCVGRKPAIETRFIQAQTRLDYIEDAITTNSPNSVTKGDIQRTNYVDRLNKINQQIAGTERSIVQFSQNRCGRTDFTTLVTRFTAQVQQYNRHILFAGQQTDWAETIRIQIPRPYHIGSLTYADPSNDCTALVLETKNLVDRAKNNLDVAGPAIDQWLVNKNLIEQTENYYNAANQAHKTARDGLRKLQEKNCHTNPQTSPDYDRLKAEVDEVSRRMIELETKLGAKAQEWQNRTANALAGAGSDFDSCKCHDITILTTEGGGPLAASVQKALCYVICGISIAIGRFACLIVGSIIDPMMNSGQQTCAPSTDNSSSSGGGASSTPSSSSSPGGGGTIPAPRPTVEDEGEPAPQATQR